jgi:hypothetical protein
MTRERDAEIDDIEEDVAEHNPDPITRRESLEQELMEEGRSDEGEEIDLEEDLTRRRSTPRGPARRNPSPGTRA